MVGLFANSLVLFGLLLEPPAAAQPSDRAAAALPRAALGITVEELPSDETARGLIVRAVDADSPAARAGLEKGDLIVRVCNRRVDDFDELICTLAGCCPDDKVSLQVVRDGRTRPLRVTLGKPAAEKAKAGGDESAAPFIGVVAVPADTLSPSLRDQLGLEDADGLLVLGVVPGSPAGKAGLRFGDLITGAGGEDVVTPEELRRRLVKAGDGKEVTLQVRHGDRKKEVKLTPTEAPVGVRLRARTGDRGESPERLADSIRGLQRQLERIEGRLREMEEKLDKQPRR